MAQSSGQIPPSLTQPDRNFKRKSRRDLRRQLLRLLAALLILVGASYLLLAAMLKMPGKSYRGPLAPPSAAEIRLSETLRRHVEKLAGEIGERNVFLPAKLEEAARWIEGEFAALGYAVRREEFVSYGITCQNLWCEIPGTSRREELIVVGAHYDSVQGSPGANDNATGVAALIEIARALRDATPARSLRFVAFANEEPPFFQTEEMGSLVHARAAKGRGERIAGMISLETIGFYSDASRSQKYPPPFSLFYPRRGDFIGFVGNVSSRRFVREAVRAFRESARFPSEGAAIPEAIPGVGWSDHWAFWRNGYPALMVTDTAPFRYPYYHTQEDTPDKVDYDRLARVVAGLSGMVARLAGALTGPVPESSSSAR